LSINAPLAPSARSFGIANSDTPRMPAIDARERQMHDVLGQGLIPTRDEHLRSGDQMMPI